jgi:hypothetical protein
MSEHPTATATAATNDDQSVASDILDGADEIAAETGKKPHQVYRDWKLGRLVGVWKDGNRLKGSKAAIRRDHRNRAARTKHACGMPYKRNRNPPQPFALHYGRAHAPLVQAVPDAVWPGMWRLLWPDGRLSDLANLARIKDAAIAICERGPPQRDRHRLHWEISPSNSLWAGRTRVRHASPYQRKGPGQEAPPLAAAEAGR